LDAAAAAEVRRRLVSPQALEHWEEEQQLSGLLQRLPDRALPPGFTERVLRALDEPVLAAAPSGWLRSIREWTAQSGWSARAAAAAAILLVVPGFWLRVSTVQRQQLASSVSAITRPVQEVAQATRLPPVEILRDFEAIDQMRRLSSLADEELLVSLETATP
jgi:hypothetical protein